MDCEPPILVVIPGIRQKDRNIGQTNSSFSATNLSMATTLAQLVINKADLILVLDNVCHLTSSQMTALVEDGYDTARSIVHWDFKSIRL